MSWSRNQAVGRDLVRGVSGGDLDVNDVRSIPYTVVAVDVAIHHELCGGEASGGSNQLSRSGLWTDSVCRVSHSRYIRGLPEVLT